MKVSIVIPTLNCAEVLKQCLISIRENDTKYDYEIIVVDGSSKDYTADVARKFADKVLVEDTFYRGVNRNKGVKAASGEIICFTDSDCIVPRNWIDSLVDSLINLNKKDPKIVGVGGGNLPYVPDNADIAELAISYTLRSSLVSFRARNMMERYSNPVEVSHNPPMNSALFKDKILEVGGFCEENNVGEDLILDARIKSKGYKLYAIPGCEVLHKHRSNFEKLRKQMFSFGRARVRTGRKYKSFFSWYHFGPAILCIFSFSPLFFAPLLLSLMNGIYVSFKNKKPLLFSYAFLATWITYISYGLGEIYELIFGRRDKGLSY
mgnify:CR=1 FL=1